MEVIYRKNDQEISLIRSPREWKELLTASDPRSEAPWQTSLFWTGFTPHDTPLRLIATNREGTLKWAVRLAIQDSRKTKLVAGFNFDEALLQDVLEHLHLPPLKNLSSTPWSLAAPALTGQTTERFEDGTVQITEWNPSHFSHEKVEYLVFLAQSAWARQGEEPPSSHLLQSCLCESLNHPRLKTFTALVDDKIRAFVTLDRSQVILWGCQSPRRDRWVVDLLSRYAQASEWPKKSKPDPQLAPKTWKLFDKFQNLLPLRQIQLHLLSTQGPELPHALTLTVDEDDMSLTVLSWDDSGILTGWTTAYKKFIHLEDWKMDWSLPAQTAALGESWSIDGRHLNLHRIHFLRRLLLVRGYLGLIALSVDEDSARNLHQLGFVRMQTLLGWRRNMLPSRLFKDL